jgi:hypothetical protein
VYIAYQTHHLKIGQPRLCDSRKIGCHLEALRSRCGKRLDQSAFRRLQNVDRLIAHEVEMTPEQVIQRGRRAFVWGAVHRRIDRVKEQQTAQMRRRTDAGKAIGHLVVVR